MSIVEELGKLSTPLVSDALDRMGVNGGLPCLRALVPGSRCAGPAFTLRFERVQNGEPAPAADYIDDVQSGSVIVIDNAGRGDCTVWGDILTQVARARGIAGTVIHGNCRDASRIRELDYPLFSTGVYMKSGKNRVRLASSGLPIVIGETEVLPGDIVCGDDSGVVVVPAMLASQVLDVAREIEGMEQRVLSDVTGGMPLRQARELHAYNRYSFRTPQ